MNVQAINKFTGMSLGEWVAAVPNELDVDGVGLWQIIPTLRLGFELDGEDLDTAARRVIRNLLDRGARPVVTASPESGYWKEVSKYGDKPEEIIDGVIAEWHSMGRDPHPGDLWFAHPSLYGDP